MAFGDKLSTKATQIVAQLPFAGCDACAECLRAKGVFDCAKQCGDCVDEGWASICSVWRRGASVGGVVGHPARVLPDGDSVSVQVSQLEPRCRQSLSSHVGATLRVLSPLSVDGKLTLVHIDPLALVAAAEQQEGDRTAIKQLGFQQQLVRPHASWPQGRCKTPIHLIGLSQNCTAAPPHLTSFTFPPASNSSRVTPPDASWSSERIRWASSVSDGGAPSFRSRPARISS